MATAPFVNAGFTARLRLVALLLTVGLALGDATHARAQGPSPAELRALVTAALDSFGVPGVAVGVVKDGAVVLSEGFGLRQNGQAARVDEHTLFAIASNTKAFVGTTAAMLHEEGALDLGAPARDYLPYLRFGDEHVTALANVTDLMTHRMGLGTFEGDHLWFKRGLTPKQVLTQVESMPLRYPFRAGYGYSNLGFIAAGEVIAKAANRPWQEVMQARIFEPLGMTRTVLHTRELAAKGNYATGHITRQGNAPIAAVAWDTPGAAGGIWSSAHDMLRWVQCNLDTGTYRGDTIWTAATARRVWKPHNTFGNNESFTSYGLGWFMRRQGAHTVLSHGGGYDGMYSQVQLVPAERLGIVVLTNGMTGLASAVATEIRNRYLGTPRADWLTGALARQRRGDAAWFARQDSVTYYADSTTFSPAAVPIQPGRYTDDVYGAFVVARGDNGALELQFPSAPGLRARLSRTPTASGAYLLTWLGEPTAWFERGLAYATHGPGGGADVLRLYIPNDDIFYETIAARRE